MKNRLVNRAITVGRLINQPSVFSYDLIRRIDSSTSIAYKNKLVQVYDYTNRLIYRYSDVKGDTIGVDAELLNDARVAHYKYFNDGKKDAIAYHYVDNQQRIVIVAAGEDVEGKANLSHLINILLVAFGGGLVIAVLGGYFFSAGLIKPVKKIADEINKISTQNFSDRIKTRAVNDEWSYLAKTVNELLTRLQNSFELQKRFIANASHELSTPLTSISSQLQVCLQRERDVSAYQGVIKSVQQDVLQMIRLTKVLLDFAKASGEAGGADLTFLRMDDILFRIPGEVAKHDKAYITVLDLEALPEEQDQLIVFGSDELICTAIKNIALNGCKYSDDHKAIIKLMTNATSVIVEVSDKGIGIDEKDIDKIFQPFYRLGEKNVEGSGLGLSLSYRIIKMHNGEIKVVSKKGEGSTFSIILPKAKTSA
jgi:signal transduction histidine kinase